MLEKRNLVEKLFVLFGNHIGDITMSNIGNKPIIFTNSVKVLVNKKQVKVIGPRGELSLLVKHVSIIIEKEHIIVRLLHKKKLYKRYHGLYRSLINNMIIGVVDGFQKILILHGLGYRVTLKEKELAFSIGFSHIIYKKVPYDLTVVVSNQNKRIQILGINKEKVGLFSSQLRIIRPPEPYLGKGIRYADELIIKKQGKTSAK